MICIITEDHRMLTAKIAANLMLTMMNSKKNSCRDSHRSSIKEVILLKNEFKSFLMKRKIYKNGSN